MDKFNENVRLICKHKGIKLGECERFIGKAAGYFSRNPNITLRDAKALSVFLNESLEDLMTRDYAKEFRKQAIIQRREQIKKDIARLNKELEDIGDGEA